jgi:hypothetical protein
MDNVIRFASWPGQFKRDPNEPTTELLQSYRIPPEAMAQAEQIFQKIEDNPKTPRGSRAYFRALDRAACRACNAGGPLGVAIVRLWRERHGQAGDNKTET